MNNIMKLHDAAVYAALDTAARGLGDRDQKTRAELEAAVEQQAAEIERLKADYENLMHGPLGKKEYEELSYSLQHERDVEAKARDKAEAERDALQAKLSAMEAAPKLAPLTDEQIEQAVKTFGVSWTGYREDKYGFYTIPVLSPYHYQFARAIEAAHGIGGQHG